MLGGGRRSRSIDRDNRETTEDEETSIGRGQDETAASVSVPAPVQLTLNLGGTSQAYDPFTYHEGKQLSNRTRLPVPIYKNPYYHSGGTAEDLNPSENQRDQRIITSPNHNTKHKYVKNEGRHAQPHFNMRDLLSPFIPK